MARDLALRKQDATKRIKNSENENILREYEEKTEALRRREVALYIENLAAESEFSADQRLFLAHLSISGISSDAAVQTGIPLHTYYKWCKDATFKSASDEARKVSSDRLELVAIALATGQYMRPIVSMGKIVTYEPIYDTKLLETMLKARKPAEFTNRVDVTSNGHSIVKLVDKDAWDSV